MSIDTKQLFELRQKLQCLAGHVDQNSRDPDAMLDPADPLIVEAAACDFLLPSPLTLGALRETVQKKLVNVATLIERATVHESLPDAAQAAAEDENAFMTADYDPDRPPR